MSRFNTELSRHHTRPITDVWGNDGDDQVHQMPPSSSQMRRSHAALHTPHAAGATGHPTNGATGQHAAAGATGHPTGHHPHGATGHPPNGATGQQNNGATGHQPHGATGHPPPNGGPTHPSSDWPSWTDAASSDVADAKASPGVDSECLDAHLDYIELYVPPLTSFLLHSTYRDTQVRHRDLSAPARNKRMPTEEATEAGLPREGGQTPDGGLPRDEGLAPREGA
jgi:hypothetical protein